jgi:hypothetical protein
MLLIEFFKAKNAIHGMQDIHACQEELVISREVLMKRHSILGTQ